jgi:hypothetical protein
VINTLSGVGKCWIKHSINLPFASLGMNTFVRKPQSYIPSFDHDVQGEDIKVLENISVVKCAKTCDHINECAFFVMTSDFDFGKCWLKKSYGKPFRMGRQSIFYKSLNTHSVIKPPDALNYELYFEHSAKGEILEKLSDITLLECVNRCTRDTRCQFFVMSSYSCTFLRHMQRLEPSDVLHNLFVKT